jgi:hypothetical protein
MSSPVWNLLDRARRRSQATPSIKRVGAGFGQQAISPDDGGACGDIFGDDRIGADGRTPTYPHRTQNLCPGTDIDAVLHMGRYVGKIAATQRDLVADHDIVADSGVSVDDNAHRMWQEHSLG